MDTLLHVDTDSTAAATWRRFRAEEEQWQMKITSGTTQCENLLRSFMEPNLNVPDEDFLQTQRELEEKVSQLQLLKKQRDAWLKEWEATLQDLQAGNKELKDSSAEEAPEKSFRRRFKKLAFWKRAKKQTVAEAEAAEDGADTKEETKEPWYIPKTTGQLVRNWTLFVFALAAFFGVALCLLFLL